MTTVAFLGLGAIGRPMAARLAAAPDIELAVWNRTADRARSFAAEHRARVAATPADAARSRRVPRGAVHERGTLRESRD